MSSKYIFEDGFLIFIEYYNDIEIISTGCSIRFLNGNIESIIMEIFANSDVHIIGTAPKITSDDALQMHISSLNNEINIYGKPKGKLCYFFNRNKKLILCWKILINAGDTKIVFLNALSGQTVHEIHALTEPINAQKKSAQ